MKNNQIFDLHTLSKEAAEVHQRLGTMLRKLNAALDCPNNANTIVESYYYRLAKIRDLLKADYEMALERYNLSGMRRHGYTSTEYMRESFEILDKGSDAEIKSIKGRST